MLLKKLKEEKKKTYKVATEGARRFCSNRLLANVTAIIRHSHRLTACLFLLLLFTSSPAHSQPVPGSYYDFIDATKDLPAGHDKTSLIIYRPDNVGVLNDIRCFLRIQDEAGNDITYDTASITATYEWMSTPDIIRNYKHTYYLSGGMAMHLRLKKGRYKISLYTPTDQQNNFVYPETGQEARTALESGKVEYSKPQAFQWESNVFEYNTENPTKVIFVTPTRNDNGFYNGGWVIDYRDGRKH